MKSYSNYFYSILFEFQLFDLIDFDRGINEINTDSIIKSMQSTKIAYIAPPLVGQLKYYFRWIHLQYNIYRIENFRRMIDHHRRDNAGCFSPFSPSYKQWICVLTINYIDVTLSTVLSAVNSSKSFPSYNELLQILEKCYI